MTDEEAESYFSLATYFIQSGGGVLTIGNVISAVIALFKKRKDQH